MIKKVAILGGGTAGWLAANHLGHALSATDIEVTLIESEDVPSIGVGEGTVPFIKDTLQKFGICEVDLLLGCDATFKQGIKFTNWMDKTRHGECNHYYHPFESPYPNEFDVTNYMLGEGSELRFDDVTIQSAVCELGLAPKLVSSAPYQGVLNYAYHFDAAKFALLLARNAKERFNVKHLKATVENVQLDDTGNVKAVTSVNGDTLAFDFFVDCTGFASLLIDKALNVPFVSKADELLTDKALVKQVPLNPKQGIFPYTKATAHQAGWIWDIPLTTRRGTGFVYASEFMSEDDAHRKYARYLNLDADKLDVRKINMEVGYREVSWYKNCVCLGLAQGFLEPLEATSILLTDFTADLLAKNFPKNQSDADVMRDDFNKAVTYAWDRTTDFIKLHYCISDRQDSDFWLKNQSLAHNSEELKTRLAKFKIRPPHRQDFFSRFDLFDEKNYLYVLYGMRYPTSKPHCSEQEVKLSRELLARNKEMLSMAQEKLLLTSEWLTKLKQAVR